MVMSNSQASNAQPPISGVGIGITGARRVVLRSNLVIGNHSTGPSQLAGGVVVVAFHGRTGASVAPSDNRIVDNVLLYNSPANIITDNTGTGNEYFDNALADG